MNEARRFLARLPPKAWGGLVLAAVVLGGTVSVVPVHPGLPSDGLFIVDVDPDSPYAAAADDGRIRADGPPDAFLGSDWDVADTPRGDAVQTILHDRLRLWTEQELTKEPDQAAAFPLRIDAFYIPRETLSSLTGDTPAPTPTTTATATGDGGADPADPAPRDPAAEAVRNQTAIGPGELDPPFPLPSLLLTFAYIVPASLLMQLHGANLHAERTKGRARVLLSTPLGPARLLAGKTAPFAVLLLVLDVAVTLALGAGWAGLLAAGTVLAFLLALTTLTALWARTPRELGMLQVGASTILNVFLFLPAMFPSLPPVAYLSPMHVVAQGMAHATIPLAALAYALVPTLLATAALVAVAIAFTTEELWLGDGARFGRAVQRASPGWKALPAGLLVVPFVFVLQLMVIVILSVLTLDVALWFALPTSVLVEEVAKRLIARGRGWRSGALAGAGFFLGEKTALLLTLVGFRDLPYGEEALSLIGSGTGALVLIAPLFLHVATGVLLTRRRWGFPAALVVHYGYDQLILGWAA